MSALKPLDFQEATANRILEVYQQKQYRVLLADEVGLGKTIIASAVIQKVADLHSAWDDHFKVIYICSNINIANQNCRKLGIPEEDCLDFQESRLSMQHLRIYESAGRDHSYMQLIPMTPATSFSMTGGQGSKHERALIYAVLHRYPAFQLYQEPLKQLLQYEHTLQWWDWNIDEYNRRIDECDAETGNYLSDMMDAISRYFKLEPAFMNYRVKDKIVDALEKQGDYRLVEQSTSMLLRRNRINRYEKIPCNNGRLQTLFNEAFSRERNGAELLLWIPASRPYYSTKSVFDKNKGYSKTLVFSSWEMVPRMIAGLTSYEAERLTVGRLGNREDAKQMRYFAQDSSEGERKRRKVVVRLRDEMEEVLTYPCRTLAMLYEPLELADRSVDEVRRIVCGRVQELLQEFQQTHQLPAVRQSAAQVVALMQTLDGEAPSYELHGIAAGTEKLLTELAIGSPAICAYRLFKGASMAGTMAMDLADKFVALFNKQESMAIIEVLYGKKDSDEAYYWNVASYCVEGNLQAVLDEYAFTLGDGCDLELLRQMKAGFVDTASIQIETRESFLGYRDKSRLRTHFAVGYFNAQVNEKTMQRTENIRSAFNSPFRPFVLATTSIGQEGLDFHNYCRKIMHWNLPSNPIDLEQREGRINRYLCHAIRQNLADSEFGAFPFEKSVWQEIMDRATVTLKQNHSDLIPYWCLPDDFPFKYKIERIVPMYPYSQDRCRYDHLMDVLSVYRLTLGQPRQEELFETIHKENWDMDELKKLYINLSPWNRAHHNGGTEHED